MWLPSTPLSFPWQECNARYYRVLIANGDVWAMLNYLELSYAITDMQIMTFLTIIFSFPIAKKWLLMGNKSVIVTPKNMVISYFVRARKVPCSPILRKKFYRGHLRIPFFSVRQTQTKDGEFIMGLEQMFPTTKTHRNTEQFCCPLPPIFPTFSRQSPNPTRDSEGPYFSIHLACVSTSSSF